MGQDQREGLTDVLLIALKAVLQVHQKGGVRDQGSIDEGDVQAPEKALGQMTEDLAAVDVAFLGSAQAVVLDDEIGHSLIQALSLGGEEGGSEVVDSFLDGVDVEGVSLDCQCSVSSARE